jgi:ATP-dependent DNA helicase
MYHGSPEERTRLRKEVLVYKNETDASQPSSPVTPVKRKGKGRPKAPKRLGVAPPAPDLPPDTMDLFPVVLTTYEMIIRDSSYLRTHKWKYIIVDEGVSDKICEW